MKILQHIPINRILHSYKTESISMRRRLALYMISAFIMLMSIILLLLNVFGITNHSERQIMEALDLQLSIYADDVKQDYDQIAAYAISFSEQLETDIQDYLSENGLSFHELDNNVEAVTELQCDLYNTVYLYMQLAPSSGAFYILDTSVNTKTETPLYNGIYLKYINLNSENTVNNDFSLYRGSFVTGDTNDITFHSGWRNEMETDFFETWDSTFTEGVYYALSPTVSVPETWENARYVYVPIHDLKGEIIGVCGFEVNDLFFQLANKPTDNPLGHLIYGLLDCRETTYNGQFSSGRFNFSNNSASSFHITKQKDAFVFHFDNDTCIGKSKDVQLGNHTFQAAIMMTKAQYDEFIHQGRLKLSALLVITIIFSFVCCIFISNQYVAPILKKIEQVKANEDSGDPSRIREIDDLFAFLAEKDSIYEEQLSAMEKAKLNAEKEAERATAAYNQALKEYQLAQSEIEHLAEEKKNEIVLEDYEFFICNLKTLTPAEYRIYQLYLDGKSAKEILEITGIKENTLKYHNKNIYSKLGVTSRKQLLRFATLKRIRDEQISNT